MLVWNFEHVDSSLSSLDYSGLYFFIWFLSPNLSWNDEIPVLPHGLLSGALCNYVKYVDGIVCYL